MLPRFLRITRAKNPQKTALALEKNKARKAGARISQGETGYKPKATPEQKSIAGRAGKILGRAGAARQLKPSIAGGISRGNVQGLEAAFKTPEQIVFEGRRATSKDGAQFLKKKVKKGRAALKSRGARRAKEWRNASAK
jgi:nucleolar protein 12